MIPCILCAKWWKGSIKNMALQFNLQPLVSTSSFSKFVAYAKCGCLPHPIWFGQQKCAQMLPENENVAPLRCMKVVCRPWALCMLQLLSRLYLWILVTRRSTYNSYDAACHCQFGVSVGVKSVWQAHRSVVGEGYYGIVFVKRALYGWWRSWESILSAFF